MKIKNKLFCISEVKAVNDEERSIEAWGSKPTLDRDGEIIATNAWTNLKDFKKKNPVLMLSHDYRSLPVGRVVSIKARPEGLWFKAIFAETARGEEVFQLYKQGIMRAFSVGFIPKAFDDREKKDEKGNPIKYRLFKKAELLEISCVSIPACPDALIAEIGEGNIKEKCIVDTVVDILQEKKVDLVINHAFETDIGKRCGGCDSEECACDGFGKDVDPDRKDVVDEDTQDDDLELELCDCEDENCNCKDKEPDGEKTVIPFKSYGIAPVEEVWNGPAVMRASDVDMLKSITTWFDGKKESDDLTKGDFKLPHHRPSDKKAVWRGVVAAMGALLGARGGVAIPNNEKRGVYDHLVGHYGEFDAEPPEFKEYNDADMKLLEFELCSTVTHDDIDFMVTEYKEEEDEGKVICMCNICGGEFESEEGEQTVCNKCFDDEDIDIACCEKCKQWFEIDEDGEDNTICDTCYEEGPIEPDKSYLCRCADCEKEFETKEFKETCSSCTTKRDLIKRNPILAGLSDGSLVAISKEDLDNLNKRVEEWEAEEKDGRVLSGKNRTIVTNTLSTLTTAVEALSILLDASEPRSPDGGKGVDDQTYDLDFSSDDDVSLEDVQEILSDKTFLADIMKDVKIARGSDIIRNKKDIISGKVL
jgi:HK97 family phage prohead protease